MKKRTFIIFTLGFFLVFAPEKALMAKSKEPKKRVGVSPFEARSVENEKADIVTDLFRSYLTAEKVYEVLDRAHVQKTMKEIEFQSSGLTDQENVVEIGKMMNAEFMIFGSLSKVGNYYRISADMIEIKTNKVANSVNQKFSDIDFVENVVKTLVKGLVRGEKVDEFAFTDKIPFKDPEKIKKYLETKHVTKRKSKHKLYKSLGFTGNYDEIQEKYYGFLMVKETKMPSREEKINIWSNVLIGTVIDFKSSHIKKKLEKANQENKDYIVSFSQKGGKNDEFLYEVRIYQKNKKPSAIEIYLVTRNSDWTAKKPVVLKYELN